MDNHGTAGSIVDILPGTLAALSKGGASRAGRGIGHGIGRGIGRGIGGDSADVLGLTDAFAGARRAIVILVDGFGYHGLPQAAPASPIIADVLAGRLGSIAELSCCFPSTTPTSLVSLGTGQLPGAHGVVGFRVNIPGTDEILTHTHWANDPDPSVWQPMRTQFETTDVSAEVFGAGVFAGSGLTVAAYRGSAYTATTWEEFPDAVAASDAALMYMYHPLVDRAGHLFGMGSPEWLDEVSAVDATLERLVDQAPPDTAIVITADHGMLNFSAGDKVDFDTVPALQDGVRLLAGEPRVRYLHTEQGATADVVAAWQETLGPDSLVFTRAEAVDTGWFGPVPAEHAARIGDVVVVCRGQQLVVSTLQEQRASALVGYHGSVSREELGIPLIVIPPR